MPPSRLDAVGAVLTLLTRVKNPRERITAIRAVRAELTHYDQRFDSLTRDAILELRAQDVAATWAEIGELLNVTPHRAYQLAEEHIKSTKQKAHHQ